MQIKIRPVYKTVDTYAWQIKLRTKSNCSFNETPRGVCLRTVARELLNVMRTTTFIAILALVCTALACTQPTTTNIAGRYIAHRPHGLETLELQTNGTYVQVFTNTTLAQTNVGQWTFQPPTLTLKSALIFDDGFGRPATPVVTNDWKLKVRYLINVWVFEDRQNEPFTQVTPENQ